MTDTDNDEIQRLLDEEGDLELSDDALPPEPIKQKLSDEEVNKLIEEHVGWTESIARSVARAWDLDWQMDGLDGAALEALLFCAKRYDPERGVPFKAYSRKRIHEASCDAAKKSKGWRKATPQADEKTRQLSAKILEMFPEIGEGELPTFDGGGDTHGSGGDEASLRGSIRGLLMGATIAASKMSDDAPDAETLMDFKTMMGFLAQLDLVHQVLLFELYWQGESMRGLAEEWEVDELTIIREHKSLVEFLSKGFSRGKQVTKLKVRPTLKPVAQKLLKESTPPFERFLA
jgi:hypothetical protein